MSNRPRVLIVPGELPAECREVFLILRAAGRMDVFREKHNTGYILNELERLIDFRKPGPWTISRHDLSQAIDCPRRLVGALKATWNDLEYEAEHGGIRNRRPPWQDEVPDAALDEAEV